MTNILDGIRLDDLNLERLKELPEDSQEVGPFGGIDSYLQVLLRNVSSKKSQALAAFFDPKDKSHYFPSEVCTKNGNNWLLKESGSEKTIKDGNKNWAVYELSKSVEVQDEEEENNSPL